MINYPGEYLSSLGTLLASILKALASGGGLFERILSIDVWASAWGGHPWLRLLGQGVGAGVWLVAGGWEGRGGVEAIQEPNSPPGPSPVTREECTSRIQ